MSLLSVNNSLPKGMKDLVSSAISEMRRYYSRKVIDVLIKITRASLDVLRKRFIVEEVENNDNNEATTTKPKQSAAEKLKPIYLVHSTLMIPNIAIRPTLDDLQEALITAGKNITGVSKGVAQWTSGKEVNVFFLVFWKLFFLIGILQLYGFFFHQKYSHHRAIFVCLDARNKMINDHDDVNCTICSPKNGHKCHT